MSPRTPETKRPLLDAEHRAQAVTRREGVTFVEAGAGSGKTTVLVERVLSLVGDGVPLHAIAAITFTERAGAELRDRLRRAIASRAAATVDHRWDAALAELDRASIGTIHAFAQRILAAHALAAHLPARFEVLDEAGSALAFEQRWRQVAARLFDAPAGGDAGAAELARAVELLLAAGVRPDQLRRLLKVFDEAWDLAATRLATPGPIPVDVLAPLAAEVRAVSALADRCIAPEDGLAMHLRSLTELADDLDDAGTDVGRLGVLSFREAKITAGNKGKAPSWQRAEGGKAAVLDELKALDARISAASATLLAPALDQVATAIGREAGARAAERFRTGRLEFHDLLVGARDLLRDPHEGRRVRAQLHDEYRAVLVDEFQDTDPLQLEIVTLVTADDADDGSAGGPPRPVDGRLFLVGDPKQSIYRFRRADLRLYLDERKRLGPPLELTTNFRSSPKVLAWINAVFARLIVAAEGSQAGYTKLRPARTDQPYGAAVFTFGGLHDDRPDAATLREREASDVATLITEAVSRSWGVATPPATPGGEPGTRPMRWSDIAILLPSRTALTQIEAALAARNVPVRVESGSMLWTAPEIAELIAVLHAACDPHDAMKVVTALRTTLLGCSDADLYRHRVERNRSFDPARMGEESLGGDGDGGSDGDGADDPVAAGLASIAAWSTLAAWAAPPVVLARVIDDTRAEALAALATRPREPLRRLRFAQEQARAFADATHGTTADWLAWIDRQRLDGTRVAEPLLPEPDDDAVRVLTVHAAKGLEFPMVVVAGLTTKPGGRAQSMQVYWPTEGGPPVTRFGPNLVSAGFTEAADIETVLETDERIRLLYVACTRARDHLAVSLHRVPPSKEVTARLGDLVKAAAHDESALVGLERLTLSWLLALAAEHGKRFTSELGPSALGLAPSRSAPDVAPAARSWSPLPERAATTISATALAHRDERAPAPSRAGAVETGAVDTGGEVDPARRKAATTLGTAVHWVLEHVEFAATRESDDDLLRLADAALAAVAGVVAGTPAGHDTGAAVPDRALVAELAATALGAPIVAAAATADHWRELYVAVPGAVRQLEGYVDLVVRTPAGLVVVDFKTDAVVPSGTAPAPSHRLQLAAYAHALATATGEPVAGAVAVYCRDAARPERWVTDLADAIAEAVALLDDDQAPNRERMRVESRAMLADPADLEEARRVLAELDDLRAW